MVYHRVLPWDHYIVNFLLYVIFGTKFWLLCVNVIKIVIGSNIVIYGVLQGSDLGPMLSLLYFIAFVVITLKIRFICYYLILKNT